MSKEIVYAHVTGKTEEGFEIVEARTTFHDVHDYVKYFLSILTVIRTNWGNMHRMVPALFDILRHPPVKNDKSWLFGFLGDTLEEIRQFTERVDARSKLELMSENAKNSAAVGKTEKKCVKPKENPRKKQILVENTETDDLKTITEKVEQNLETLKQISKNSEIPLPSGNSDCHAENLKNLEREEQNKQKSLIYPELHQ